ncbi:MJ0042-type zinc finger domain-containing protein [Solidesulfovibrio sp.]
MILNTPKMWTFRHNKKDKPECGAVFQAENDSIDASGSVKCPNCGESFAVKDVLDAHLTYKTAVSTLRRNGLRVYPPEAEIEAFETHIAHMKDKEGDG